MDGCRSICPKSVGAVPGLVVRDRQNYAQDAQLSVRGFGSRASFGVRGVRIYVDDIPATLPDGQGQISHIDLGSVDHIEVLRGPFSALYGNSSGGVIAVFTEDGKKPATLTPSFAFGSDRTLRTGLKFSGASGSVDGVADISRFTTAGYRDHSAAQRNIGNAKLNFALDPASTLKIVVNSVALRADDPLGVTHAAFEANPRQVDAAATSFDTRKTINQTQAGLVYTRKLDDANAVRAVLYAGHRNIMQFLAIPVGAQRAPSSAGGVIALGRDYRGADLRWTGSYRDAWGGPLTIVAGLSQDRLYELRRGYQNFIGATLGVQGALRRDDVNDVSDTSAYLQASWRVVPRWTIDAGVRNSVVRFRSTDQYVVAGNPDDSGSARYSAVLPVAGIVYAPSAGLRFYASAGRGFETPTLNELSYRANGATGLNFALQPSRSNSVEAGIKARSAALGTMTLALFRVNTRDELVTQTNVGGRATFQNAGNTRRNGIEVSLKRDLFADTRVQIAYTWLEARYRNGFLTCTATPCARPATVVAAGNRIPGIAQSTLYGELAWEPQSGWRAGVEMRASSKVWVDDLNSDAAPSYVIAAVRGGYVMKWASWTLNAFARIDNLFARRYAGSVIVNESNRRYFEPAPGRTATVGLSASAPL